MNKILFYLLGFFGITKLPKDYSNHITQFKGIRKDPRLDPYQPRLILTSKPFSVDTILSHDNRDRGYPYAKDTILARQRLYESDQARQGFQSIDELHNYHYTPNEIRWKLDKE